MANAVHGSSTAEKAQEAIQTFIGEVPEGEGEEGEEGEGRENGEGAEEGADENKGGDKTEKKEEKGANHTILLQTAVNVLYYTIQVKKRNNQQWTYPHIIDIYIAILFFIQYTALCNLAGPICDTHGPGRYNSNYTA